QRAPGTSSPGLAAFSLPSPACGGGVGGGVLPARAERIARAVAVAAGPAVRARTTVATVARATLARGPVTALATRRAVAALAARATVTIVTAVAALAPAVAAVPALAARRAVATLTTRSPVAVAALAPGRPVAAVTGATLARAALAAEAATRAAVAATIAALAASRARTAILAILAATGADVGRGLARLEQRAPREVDPALAVDLGDQDGHLVADVDHVFDARHPVVGQLRDVDEPFLAGQYFDERAERHQPS